ncbi:MAG: T9SS type A sorting domain-containing protein [Bacteroidota bacterium]
MKKKIYMLILTLMVIFGAEIKTAYGQTLDHSYYLYHKDFYVIDLGNNNYKYAIQDSTGFSLYNLDATPYLLNVIPPIPLVVSPSYYQVSYISSTLFDCDSSNIEYILTSSVARSNFYIYRTDGTLLFERDSVSGSYAFGMFDGSVVFQPIMNTPSGTKLFLQDNKWGGIIDSEYVYSLCGTLSIVTSIMNPSNKGGFVQIFPNPTDGIINFQINPPNNHEQFQLIIYDSSFQQVEKTNINGTNYQLDLKQKSLAPGTYLYSLKSDKSIFQTGKFIITK